MRENKALAATDDALTLLDRERQLVNQSRHAKTASARARFWAQAKMVHRQLAKAGDRLVAYHDIDLELLSRARPCRARRLQPIG